MIPSPLTHLGPVGLPEAVGHAPVHLTAIRSHLGEDSEVVIAPSRANVINWTQMFQTPLLSGALHLLVLKPGLDEVEGEDAADADNAGDAAVDDLGEDGELLGGGLGQHGLLVHHSRHHCGLSDCLTV